MEITASDQATIKGNLVKEIRVEEAVKGTRAWDQDHMASVV
jgi:hypothetical protein